MYRVDRSELFSVPSQPVPHEGSAEIAHSLTRIFDDTYVCPPPESIPSEESTGFTQFNLFSTTDGLTAISLVEKAHEGVVVQRPQEHYFTDPYFSVRLR